MDFIMGLDLGQMQDYTALAILEKTNSSDNHHNGYQLRHLERFKLGTEYPVVVERVIELLLTDELKKSCHLVIDATGVGRAVIDIFRWEGLTPIAITITGGDSVSKEGAEYRVPKRDLVGVVQALLQTERLKIAKSLPLAKTLLEELQNFKVKITLNAHDTYGEWREGKHDDLVLAVAMACWFGENYIEPLYEVILPSDDGFFFS